MNSTECRAHGEWLDHTGWPPILKKGDQFFWNKTCLKYSKTLKKYTIIEKFLKESIEVFGTLF